MNSASEKRLTYIGIGLFFVIMCGIALFAKGTGDDGDSISHFFYSRDAFLFPKYFFNHWAKPLFVLISAPFAQFGLVGVKLMNVVMLTASLVLTYKLACRFKMPNAWLAPLFVVAQQRVLTHTLSGLTEPMFALALVCCVWLYHKERYFWGTLLASFLPFVRSEGLIIFCVLVIYLAIRKQWKYIPFLSFGHIFYSVAGYSTHESLLWVFSKMVYATTDHVYGIGKWNDFIVNMPWVTGGFVYFMLVVGLLDGLRRLILFLKKKMPFDVDEMWLVYGIFVAYFIAHSLFWMYGIFSSQGLMRVMLCVAPMMGIICSRGANLITEGVEKGLPKLPSLYVRGLLVLLALVFLYRNLNWQIDFNLHPSQLTQYEAAAKYKDKVQKEGYSLYSESMYIDLIFGLNPFEDTRHRSFHQILKHEPVPTKSLLVWESIFAGGMYKVPFDTIKNDRRFQLIDSFQHADFIWGGTFKTYVFQTDTAYIRQLTDNKPLFFNDFESTNYPNQDHSRTKQSTFIIKLDEKQPFAPGMEGTISSYFTKHEHHFKVSFDVYVEDVNQVPSVVFQTITTTGQSADWKNYTLETQIKSAHKWYSVSIIGTSRQTTDVRDVFKTYVWHPNKAPAYIDNFKVEYAD